MTPPAVNADVWGDPSLLRFNRPDHAPWSDVLCVMPCFRLHFSSLPEEHFDR
ncbi:hypothetical protein [Synechococcus sp. KORDI-52]|uniref:hypothetical protein n=1 Tax=Synechococcus sp. KORDI-52 TaxID=585425 RepID=UPI001C1E0624|nr:hypothetical protein [Synechococcus sp. KORDI-52]